MAVNDYTADIDAEAATDKIDPRFLRALVSVESGGNPNAVSPAGARGLTQLMPATARGLGVADPMDPKQNLHGGAELLARHLAEYGGDPYKAALAYHSGPKAVATGRVGPEGAKYQTKFVDAFKSLGGQVPEGAKPLPQTISGKPDKTKDPGNGSYAVTGVHADEFKQLMDYVDDSPEMKGIRAAEGEQYAANEVLKQQAKVYQSEMDKLIGKMRENSFLPEKPDLEKVPKEVLEPIRDPLTALRQFLPMLALLGGTLNKRFALAAMDSATAAMNAQKAGDYAKRDQAHELWLDNTKRVVENNAAMINDYNMALGRKKATADEIKAEMEALAAKWGDDVTIAGLPTKKIEALYKGIDAHTKAVEPVARIIAVNAAANAKIKPFTTITGTMVNYSNGQYLVASGEHEGEPYDPVRDGKIQAISAAPRSAGAADRQGFIDQYEANHGGQAPPQSVIDQWESTHKAANSELTKIDNQIAALEPFANTAKFEADRVLKRIETGSYNIAPAFNKWVQEGRKAGGDPQLALMYEALNSLKSEYGKIMSGSQGSVAQLAAHNQNAVDDVLNGHMSYDTIKAVVPSMIQSIDARLNNLEAEKEKVSSQIGSNTAHLAGAPDAPAPPPAAPAPSTPKTPLPDSLKAQYAKVHAENKAAAKARIEAAGYDVSGLN